MQDFLKDFGHKIRTERTKRKMSQEKLAELIGMSAQTVSIIERGIYFTNYPVLKKLCEVFNLAPMELFDFDNKLTNENKDMLEIKILYQLKNLDAKQKEKAYRIIKTLKEN